MATAFHLRLRTLIWCLPLAFAACLLLAWRSAEHRADFERARELLTAQQEQTARRLLATLPPSPSTAAQARAGLEIVHALTALDSAFPRQRTSELDVSAYPLQLMIRKHFDRGELRSALRLAELAEALGQPTVPVVTAAALIEEGRIDEARAVIAGEPAPSGELARRVTSLLEHPGQQSGVLLRDRFGVPFGSIADGELKVFDGVRPQLIPRAVVELAGEHRDVASLWLALDLELAEAAYSALGRFRGSIVLLDPATGEILAAVSDRRTLSRQDGTPAFEQQREPASISKLITVTAARRAGLDPDAEIGRMRCRGHESYSGELLYCPHIAGRLRGLERAMAVSCNVAFASLGVLSGRQAMLAELERYGFDAPLGRFPGGRIVEPRGDDRQLADLSIGLEATDITPLHAAAVAAVMANDGVMAEPVLVIAEDGRLGLHPRLLPLAPGRRVIDSAWVPEIVQAMETVVRRGTAQRVWPPASFPVAMKTGTASHPRYGFHVNYIGFGPTPHPRLAFAVRITNQGTSRKVRWVAQRVTHQLLRNLGRIAERRGWSEDGFAAPDQRLPQSRVAADRHRAASGEARAASR